MSLNKKILAAAIVSGLFAANADAAVTLTATGSNTPVVVAQELIIPAAGTVITNATNTLDITSTFGYSFSPGEVRYARIECSPNVRFQTAAVSATTNPGGLGIFGSINGVGTNAIYFSVTANATDPVLATQTFTVNGDRLVMGQGAASCTYSLYDLPSQAQAGGTAGRIATRSGSYIAFGPSYALEVDQFNTNIADVEANPVYTKFTGAVSPTRAEIGEFSYGTTFDVAGTTQPIKADGTAVTLTDLMAAGTRLAFAGDFTIAANANGTYTGAALSRVFLSTDNCATLSQAATSVSATGATFTIGANNKLGNSLCLQSRGGVAIPVSNYTVALEPTSAAPATYNVTGRGPLALGEIVRNGTELQAPLAQVPAGWLSRMVLTNTGSLPRPYEIEVFGEAGNTISTNNLTGTVPANGTVVVDLNDVLTGFTGAPRATLNVTVAGPNSQIQGLYQIVNPDKGSISNHVMVRPGTN